LDGGAKCWQLLANYQQVGNGYNGYLRLMNFKADGSCDVWTYSPALHKFLTDAGNQFALTW
jgi:hypothetical protein